MSGSDRYFAQNKYYLSDHGLKDNNYTIKKRAKTNNINLIFTLKYIGKEENIGLKYLVSYLKDCTARIDVF